MQYVASFQIRETAICSVLPSHLCSSSTWWRITTKPKVSSGLWKNDSVRKKQEIHVSTACPMRFLFESLRFQALNQPCGGLHIATASWWPGSEGHMLTNCGMAAAVKLLSSLKMGRNKHDTHDTMTHMSNYPTWQQQLGISTLEEQDEQCTGQNREYIWIHLSLQGQLRAVLAKAAKGEICLLPEAFSAALREAMKENCMLSGTCEMEVSQIKFDIVWYVHRETATHIQL